MKSKRFLIILAVPVSVFLVLLACILFSQLLVVDLVIPLPKFPEDIQIYKMVTPDITAEYISALGAKWSLKGDVKQYDTGFSLQDIEKKVTLNVSLANGYIEYDTASQPSIESPTLPTYEEAVTIATGFLSQAGLLTDGMKPYQVSVGETAGATPLMLRVLLTSQVDVNNTVFPGDQRDNINNISFSGGGIAEIDNILLPGGQSMVEIGNAGKVTRMSFRPIQCVPSQTVKIKPVDQAYREMKADENRSRNDFINQIDRFRGSHFISVDSITISYCLESQATGREWVYPIYVFKGQSRVFWKGPAHPYRNIISATDLYSLPRMTRY